MRVPVVWLNLMENKKRALAAVAGIGFSVLLVFMQLGFFDNGKRNATLFYHYLDADLILTSCRFELLDSHDFFDRMRLRQALLVPGVEGVGVVNLTKGRWVDPASEEDAKAMIFGLDLAPEFISDPGIRSALPLLEKHNTVLLDRFSHEDYGPMQVGRTGKINGTEVRVAGLFSLGMRFHSDGAVITDNGTFLRLCPRDARRIDFGLIRLRPGARAEAVQQALIRRLPGDVRVFRKDEIIENDQHYFITVLPVGIMFLAGVMVAFVVGALILYQVLHADITRRLHEFAALKSMGFSSGYIYGIGVRQALLLGALAYLPALGITVAAFAWIQAESRLPMAITPAVAASVLGLALAMSTLSALFVLFELKKADPADLF